MGFIGGLALLFDALALPSTPRVRTALPPNRPAPDPLGSHRRSGEPRPLLPADTIRQFARESGFVVRKRKIDPVVFLWTLVLDFGVELHRFLEELRYAYVKSSELEELAYPSYYLRFNAELCEFLRLCLQHAIAQLPREPGRELDPRLKAFVEDVVIKDSSVVRLHASLATKWPATRSRKVAAGVKVDLLVSVCANGPKSVALIGERTADVKTLASRGLGEEPDPPRRPRLLLPPAFAKIDELWRLLREPLEAERGSALRAVVEGPPGEGDRPGGEATLGGASEAPPGRVGRRGGVDVPVAGLRGHRSTDTFRCRIVAVWDDKNEEYHTYLTNIPLERLTAEEVAQLYGLRWEIELTFKELKSHYALDQFRTTKAMVVEALIWSALLTLVASRQIHNMVRRIQPPELRARYPMLKWARVFRSTARDILWALLGYLGVGGGKDDRYRAINAR